VSEARASAAMRAWRTFRRGVLLCGEIPHKTGLAVDPATGVVAIPLPTTRMNAEQFVLFMPEESDDALQVLLTKREGEVEEALRDRWLMLHLEPPRGDVRWIAFDPESARLLSEVIDHEELAAFNPLASVEPALVKMANTDRELLRGVCRSATGSLLTDPVCVEVNPAGLLVRHKLGVTLAPFAHEAHDEAAAQREAEALLSGRAS
jgi:hypothetical protein